MIINVPEDGNCFFHVSCSGTKLLFKANNSTTRSLSICTNYRVSDEIKGGDCGRMEGLSEAFV